jgi:hypothetical protein
MRKAMSKKRNAYAEDYDSDWAPDFDYNDKKQYIRDKRREKLNQRSQYLDAPDIPMVDNKTWKKV